MKVGTHQSDAKSRKFLQSCPYKFLALKVQLVVLVLVVAFVMVSAVWSVSCLLFYSRCPRAQPFVKVGARAPHALWSRRHCWELMIRDVIKENMGISKALLKLGGVHTSLWFHQRNINVFTDCLKRLYYKSGSLTSVGRLFQT